MPEPTPLSPQKPRGPMMIMLILLGVLLLTFMLVHNITPDEPSWSRFLDNVRAGKVIKIRPGPDFVQVEPVKGAGQPYRVFYPGPRGQEAEREMMEAVRTWNDGLAAEPRPGDSGPPRARIEIEGTPPPSALQQMLPSLLGLVLVFVLLYFFVFRRMGQGGGVLSFGKSRAQLITKGKTGKTFKDVAGIDEAREEVEELVAFLKNPKKFQKLGGRIPRGVLLVGPPGTGKTLLAKAIAGEADVPFYSISGSDFVEMFVGVGASRVRDLFSQAKDSAPCIIFIDEIDAVGRRRGQGVHSGGHDEREQTLNAILVEMDGFSSTDKVVVIAATNRVDVLDPALLRPGRFDRHIHVALPDIAGREQILNVHAGKVKMGRDVDLSRIARGTPGFSGADLESLINEAALHAARSEQETVTQKDLEYARDRVAFGREKKSGSRAMPEKERVITAYHEAGHTILQVLIGGDDELHKVTIIPRGRALGATFHLPTEDRHTHGRAKLLNDICILYGGRIAEQRFCHDITTGASNDIQRATQIARGMIFEWGMSEKMGPVKYTEDHDGMMGTESVVAVSAQTRRELDEEVRALLDQEYRRADAMIQANEGALERIAKALLEHETLDAVQVRTLIAGGELPPRKPTVVIQKAEAVAGGAASEPSPPGEALEPRLA